MPNAVCDGPAGRRAWATSAMTIGLMRAALALCLIAPAASSALGQGVLEQIRDDVRTAPPAAASPDHQRDDHGRERRHGRHPNSHEDWDPHGHFGLFFGELVFYTLSSPFWGPYRAVEDDFGRSCYFTRYPYDGVPGYMMDSSWRGTTSLAAGEACGPAPGEEGFGAWPRAARRWAARFSAEYAEQFDRLQRVGGRLLLSSASRWGLDTEMSYLQERLAGGTRDQLWIGDCNVIFRFAQSERTQWRTGLGFSWIDDPAETNFGFNFTYGVDFFPVRPWVLSSTVDWGTLGRSDLFRFQATAGAVVHRVETYAGYEYLDLGSTQVNSLIGGVRIWF